MDSEKMKNLVEISTIVTESTDFFSIKDKIVEKMLEVVHPARACVNLFYDNDYENVFLVCSSTLKYIPKVFTSNDPKGVKINFDIYSDFIHEAIEEKKIVYVKNVFEDDRARGDREIASIEGYLGRIVFPLLVNKIVVGFMTCFLDKNDFLTEQEMNFISSVASLLSLSIEITNKNNNIKNLIDKFRRSIIYTNSATRRLYQHKDIKVFLDDLSKQVCKIFNSKESLIMLNKKNSEYFDSITSFHNIEGNNTALYPIVKEILKNEETVSFRNNIKKDNFKSDGIPKNINSYIFCKLEDQNGVIGCIICANSNNYTNDDLNIFSFLASQVTLAVQLYEYSENEIKHKVLEKELNILSKQQELIMDRGKMVISREKELYYYHRAAKLVGGDFYFATNVDEDKVVFIVADVMGHGMVSNYMVAMIKGSFKVLCNKYNSAKDILNNINITLYDEFDKMDVFATCLVGIIDAKKNTLSMSNAGHYCPIIVSKEGKIDKDVKFSKGVPIGVLNEIIYDENLINLDNCSMLCMFTDGVLEIKNDSKEEFGVERLEKFLTENYMLGRKIIVENLKSKLKEFSSKDSFNDDILVVMLKG